MKTTTVTVGIPAYNEEKNIGILLRALKRQTQKNIHIIEILVYSDGSTDRTADQANSVHDSRIRVLDDKVRRGKPTRINDLFDRAGGDVIVLFDADVTTTDSMTIERLVSPFRTTKNVHMTGGNQKGLPPKSLTETALNNLNEAYNIIRQTLHNGHNAYGARGSIYAVSRVFAKTIVMHTSHGFDDNYIYLLCKKRGYRFIHVPTACVWYRCPQTARDQINQGTRYISNRLILQRYFSQEMLEHEFHVPFRLRMQVFKYQIIHNPAAYLWLKLLSVFCIMKRRQFVNRLTAKWAYVTTSKAL